MGTFQRHHTVDGMYLRYIVKLHAVLLTTVTEEAPKALIHIIHVYGQLYMNSIYIYIFFFSNYITYLDYE